MKNADIADTYIFLRNIHQPSDKQIVYQVTLPYFKRSLEITAPGNITDDKDVADYELCLLARNSNGLVRRFYKEQCKNLTESLTNGKPTNFIISNQLVFTMWALCAIFNL